MVYSMGLINSVLSSLINSDSFPKLLKELYNYKSGNCCRTYERGIHFEIFQTLVTQHMNRSTDICSRIRVTRLVNP